LDDLYEVPVDILLVEDNPGDVRLTLEALKEASVINTVHVVENGIQALGFLRNQGEYEHKPRPGLIILDLNLPIMDGRAVLDEIKKDEGLRVIPVIVLTTSQDHADVMKSYLQGANCYVTKPTDLDQYLKTVRSIDEFWTSLVKLPPPD
jgi:two-component system, chemotaxis family, response regulator Rcp1